MVAPAGHRRDPEEKEPHPPAPPLEPPVSPPLEPPVSPPRPRARPPGPAQGPGAILKVTLGWGAGKMTEAALVEGQVKLRDGKKVGARRGRGVGGARARAAAHAPPCPRSGRVGGWCCASRRQWQVSGAGGWGTRGVGA
ncbi:hypothetical protein P7K49_005958 [Saguinus oedipus]|uniref:Uncharacterized protein n=1 Tax=Saguinus oedipus TaxID=9490 RepID=A0ABQ9W111_SAGOE|nr:hypothetical protein P7K49_005958 [Saguinus oedipus]